MDLGILKLGVAGHDPRWPIHVWVDSDPNAVDIKQVLVCCEHPMAVYYQRAKGVRVVKHMNRAIRIAYELAGLHINLNDTYFEYMEDNGSVIDRFDKMPEHWFLRHRAGWHNLVWELSNLSKDYPTAEEILECLKAGNGKFARHEEAKAGGIVVTASDATPAW